MVASTAARKAIRAARDVMGKRTDRLITLLPVHPIRGPSSDGTGGSHTTLHSFTCPNIERAAHACRNVTATSPADAAAGFGDVGHCARECACGHLVRGSHQLTPAKRRVRIRDRP